VRIEILLVLCICVRVDLKCFFSSMSVGSGFSSHPSTHEIQIGVAVEYEEIDV